MRTKVIVHYKPCSGDLITIGCRAFVNHVLDHPSPSVSNTRPVITSAVVKFLEAGHGFETENSIYQAV